MLPEKKIDNKVGCRIIVKCYALWSRKNNIIDKRNWSRDLLLTGRRLCEGIRKCICDGLPLPPATYRGAGGGGGDTGHSEDLYKESTLGNLIRKSALKASIDGASK